MWTCRSARSREFKPLAEAVSVIGTDAMISVGIAAYVIAVPMATSIDNAMTTSAVLEK